MSNVIPVTVVECGGCDEELNLLAPHLSVQIKAERSVLVADASADPFGDPSVPTVNLGTQSGRGRLVNFHNFACVRDYGDERASKEVKLEPHTEDEVYVPEDNRTPEELVAAGDLPEAMLAVYDAANAEEGGEA